MNPLDAVIGYFDPQAGLRRTLARKQMERVRAYEGASTRDGWIPRRAGASANADQQADGAMLRVRARSLVQNNPYAAKALSSLVANIVGDGILMESGSSIAKTRKALNTAWEQWSSVCDADGLQDIYGLTATAYRAMEQDGEVLIRLRWRRPSDGLPVPLQLQLLEIDYLDTAKSGSTSEAGGPIISGVELDYLGRIAAYWLYQTHPGDRYGYANIAGYTSKRYPAAEIIHLFASDRPGQLRGITRFAPVIARMRDLAIYEDAELARKQNESLFSVFVSGDGADFAIPEDGQSQATAGETARQLGELGTLRSGAIMATGGQSVTVAAPAPAAGHAEYLRMQLYAVAAGLGVTYEMLTGDMSQVNFSSGRMGKDEFKRHAQQRQWHVLIPRLLTPIWTAFVDAATLAGVIPKADYAVEFTPPKWDYVNPVQDVQADADEIRTGLSSLSEKLRSRGYRPEKVFAEIGADYQALKAAGALDMITLLMGKPVSQGAIP